MDHVQFMDVAGPATIYALSPQFDSMHSYYGLTVTSSERTFFGGGRNIILDGMSFNGLGPTPSLSQSIIIQNSQIGSQNEVDKAVEHLEYDNVTGIGHAQIFVQSSSVTDLVINNSALTSLNGTPLNTTISNSSLDLLNVGPDFYGQGGSITVNDSTIARVKTSAHGVDPSLFTFNDGVFRVANASASDVWAWAVPGHEYFFAVYDGSIHMTDDNGHVTMFKVLDVRQDATYTYVDTDLGAILPTPTFLGGQPANQYLGYAVMVATEINSGPAQFNIGEIAPLVLVPAVGPLSISALGSFDNDGNPDFVWTSNASMSMGEYNPATQTVTNTSLGPVPNWAVVASAHFSDANGTSASSTQMLMDYPATGTMTLWWVSNGALTGINLGQRWPNISFISAGQFTDNGGAGISNFLVTNVVDHHLYDWWIGANGTLQGIDLGPFWSNVAAIATGQFTANGGTNLLVTNAADHHLYDWWIGANNTLHGIDLGPYWSNVDLVATGQFTANGGTNFVVSNTVDHHLYDWWIGANNTLQGIDLGAFWLSNVQLVTVGHFDNNTTNAELLVQNTVDHHLYEWWITPQGKLAGIDLGPYWANVQLISNSHYNNNSAFDELLVHNVVDGHFYEWWISNNQLQGVDLGAVAAGGTMAATSSSTLVSSNTTAASPASSAAADASPPAVRAGEASIEGLPAGSSAIDASLPAISPDRTALLAQTMASFGSDDAVVNSNNVLSGADVAPQTEIAAPIDQHLALK
jgi:hypothetical protein